MSTSKPPTGGLNIPLVPLTTHRPVSPRQRSASLSFARSPLLTPTTSMPPHIRQLSQASTPLERIDDASSDSDRPDALSKETARRGNTYDEEDDMEATERDIEAMDTALLGSSDGEIYKGPFQSPNGPELMGIVISVTVVALLAVVACCTTVYDWVL